MSINMRVSRNYGTHLGLLIQAVNKTSGPILELGVGIFSTPYLHYAAISSGRQLVSYDNHRGWLKFFIPYQSLSHQLILVRGWDEADIERSWDVALVDHSPGERRRQEVGRLASYAKYIIIHDANEKDDREYHYSEIYPLFKYRKVWDKDANSAAILSNFDDLKDFY